MRARRQIIIFRLRACLHHAAYIEKTCRRISFFDIYKKKKKNDKRVRILVRFIFVIRTCTKTHSFLHTTYQD